MRVLELGTGLGHVALAVAQLVGETGSVVAIDQAEPLLAVAERRRAEAGVDRVGFVRGDARTFRDEQPFDAIVARLLLFHLPDARDVVRRHLGALRAGGVLLAIDFDVGAARADPPVELVTTAVGWVEAAFRSAGADPRIGAHLTSLLRDAGVRDVTSFGVQAYLGPEDGRGPALLAGVVGSLAGQVLAAGIATEAELGLATLEDRIARRGAARRRRRQVDASSLTWVSRRWLPEGSRKPESMP
jgi:SAM-dependent methyltransferase